ncbi:hypothetical protein WA538_005724 [Blastocystis sp. DL]
MSELTWPSAKVRSTFIKFFEDNGHTFVKSSPVVPLDDPTLLFANAGMNQYKPIFLGQVDPTSPLAKLKRACNSQKCIRAGGKHNDLDDVGKDVYHHTFFEMLGNWSFGDYFKKGAIDFAWELLTKVYGLDPSRMYATYFEGSEADGVECDNEAFEIWKTHLPEDHILRGNKKDNFWEMGEVGPCGPCSEIHYDRIGGRNAASLVNKDDPNVIEIWNLVFMQYSRDASGKLHLLPARHVDTGMGFERLTSILQGKMSNYDTDVFTPIFAEIHRVAGVGPYTGLVAGQNGVDKNDEEAKKDMAYRVVADHIRTLTMAITDGAVPSNAGRGYVLRRILRRGVRYGQQILKCKPGFFSQLVPVVVANMKDAFPELEDKMHFVQEVILEEELSFNRTLEKGLKRFAQEAERCAATGSKQITGDVAFFLYGTLGFPIDLTQLMAEEAGLTVDMEGYQRAMEAARAEAKASHKGNAGTALVMEAEQVDHLKKAGVPTTDDLPKYTWYQTLETEVVALFASDKSFPEEVTPASGEVGVILKDTSFYAESGGQVADQGVLVLGDARFIVLNVMSYGGYVLHIGTVEQGVVRKGDRCTCNVDYERRMLIAPNHTLTHVMNWALRRVLQTDVDQKGSLVDDQKLRFDFNNTKPVAPAQLAEIERLVNEKVNSALTVYTSVVPIEEARQICSLRAVFGEHYPNMVRVVSIGKPVAELLADPKNPEWMNYSVEFCGGTHLSNLAQAKFFAIVEEGSISKGIRRIVAITGDRANESIVLANQIQGMLSHARSLHGKELEAAVTELQQLLPTAVISVPTKVAFKEELKALEKTMMAERKEAVAKQLEEAVAQATAMVAEVKEKQEKGRVAYIVEGIDSSNASKLMQKIRELDAEGSYFLFSVDKANSKVAMYALVAKEKASKTFSAKTWISEVAAVCGGKGGGSPMQAQGQSKDTSNVAAAFEKAKEILQANL